MVYTVKEGEKPVAIAVTDHVNCDDCFWYPKHPHVSSYVEKDFESLDDLVDYLTDDCCEMMLVKCDDGSFVVLRSRDVYEHITDGGMGNIVIHNGSCFRHYLVTPPFLSIYNPETLTPEVIDVEQNMLDVLAHRIVDDYIERMQKNIGKTTLTQEDYENYYWDSNPAFRADYHDIVEEIDIPVTVPVSELYQAVRKELENSDEAVFSVDQFPRYIAVGC